MTLLSVPAAPTPEDYAELRNGDRMSQKEFHRAYERMPSGFEAELIGGIVYVASPLSTWHGDPHAALGAIFFNYRVATPA